MRAIALVILVACGASSMRRPVRSQALGERIDAYNDLELVEVWTSRSGGRAMALGNGRRASTEDLEANVTPESVTATSSRRLAPHRRSGRNWIVGSWVTSMILCSASVVAALATDHGWLVAIGIGAGTAVGFGGFAIGSREIARGDVDRDLVFMHYNADLREALDLCIDRERLVACTGSPTERH